MTRQLKPFNGYICCDEPIVHFGLGSADKIEKLSVLWPGGIEQSFENLDVNQRYTITEPSGQVVDVGNRSKLIESMFKRVSPALRHRELEYDDFARQPLLPNKLSQLGPALAIADVDGDGNEEFFLGGAAGSSGQLQLKLGGNAARKQAQALRKQHAVYEDMGALFFDADGDGDQDLYVVSGGVECKPDDDLLRDRLYLNDGNGALSLAPQDSLPKTMDSGSCVVAADFDRDGDLDLFVGSRSIPGRYPVSPKSRLLRNESENGVAKFIDATDQIANGLADVGMVTGAVCSDANGDGWVDLLVTIDWDL